MDCSSLADEEGGGGEQCLESAMVAQLQPTQLSDWMDPAEAARQQRIARYKEERRRQLDAQYGRANESAASSSSSGGGFTIRSTRASRLRSAAVAAVPEGGKTVVTPRRESATERKEVNGKLGPSTPTSELAKEKSPLTLSDTSSSSGARKVRDKSSKRKSNLNRSLNAEPAKDSSEDVLRRQRSVGASPAQSPAKSLRTTPTSVPSTESDTPRPSNRVYKRITPPRESPRPRPRSSSALLERQNSSSPFIPENAPTVAPASNEVCSLVSPTESLDAAPDPTVQPDLVVLPSRPSSILKKKSLDETTSNLPSTAAVGKPVSILKRKTSQEEGSASTSQPVTFSPSVLEPVSRRQGILKKHCSLDEGSVGTGVLTRRSASPDKPILKQQRRSSLEDLRRRTHSPEPQSILKRKTSRDEAVEASATNEPQGILKRKTSISSGSVHMTIAETVILAVAGEDSLADDHVRPILKKKNSLCEEPPRLNQDAGQATETPRPILKKKSSSETDDGEEKPMKPILKSRRDSGRVSEGRNISTDHETLENEADNRPLQNGTDSRVEPLSAFSARSESCSPERSVVAWKNANGNNADFVFKRRSFDGTVRFKDETEEESHVNNSLSVAERIINMESFLAYENQRPRSLSPTQIQGMVPRRRDRERFRTQPITIQELSNSKSWSREEGATQAVVETCHEMEQEESHPLTRSDSVSARASLFEAQLKQKEDEAKPKRILRGSAARRVKLDPSRFQTQPVTQGEVEEAKRAAANEAKPSSDGEDDPNDPSKLSLAERVQLFNRKMVSERGVSRSARYKTQPVTPDELQKAQRITPISRTASSVLVSGILKNLTEKNEGPKSKHKAPSDSEEESISDSPSPLKRGILKSPSQGLRAARLEAEEERLSVNLKSVLKKESKKGAESERRSKDLHSILKVSRDKESSSSEETESDSEDDKPNTNSDLIDLLHKVEAQARGERRISTSPEQKKLTLVTSNNKKSEESDKLMNLKNLDQEKENYDITRRTRRKRTDGAELSEGDSSSSGGREVRKIIGNEAIARRRQAGLAREAAERVKKGFAEGALSKSRSHSTMNGDVVVRPPSGAEPSPLRRCRTQPMDECDEPVNNGVSIAQRLQALQKSGQTDWKKRISRLNPEEELTTTISINAAAEVLKERLAAAPRSTADTPPLTTPLDERLGLLETSTQGWRRRVNPSDATQFSVAGRMAVVPPSPLPSPASERKKKTPKPERFRSKGAVIKDAQSMPTSPEVETTLGVFKRSISAPGDDDKCSLSSAEGETVSGPLVSVPRAFDDDFTNFFKSSTTNERIELKDEDLETVTSSTSQLLVHRRRVKVQRRHGASSNPVKTLAARTDLRSEYVEVKSGIANREEKRLRIEKLAKNSSMAVEALAGLASHEDFAGVQLRKAAESTAHLSPMLPYKEIMLLQVKGRRHVQTRLVQPHYSSINQGDSYVLITPTQVFHWVGEFSNVIERSRGAEIAQHIIQTRDLGCTATQVTTVQGNVPHKPFWQLLGADEDTANTYTGAAPGHPDEDELYEFALTGTNMIYEVEGEELVPRMDCWGSMPRIEILDHNKVLVMDFGSELYIWMGKTVTLERRRTALRLGQELWDQGYDYSECDVCPLTQAQSLGTRTGKQLVDKAASKRPEWALLAKVTQHMETVLLREKFLDWPDFSRVIQVKSREKHKQVEASVEVKPCDVLPMVNWEPPEPDLELEGSHLGRGTKYYDPETHRHFEVSTLSVTSWHIQEFDSTELESTSLGQLHSGDSYVIRWCYTVTVTGRELTGAPSRHSTVGRDRCCYWTWQGSEASTNDKGAAALLTVQLDKERGPQLRLTQGQEPPAFRQLFGGGLIVHRGRRSDKKTPGRWRLYLVLGEEVGEAMLVEVVCSVRQLRSRACLVLLDTEDGQAYLWSGAQALPHIHAVALAAVEKLKARLPAEAGLEDFEEIDVEEITEGKEPKMFFEALGGHSRQLYVSLPQCEIPAIYSPRLFRLTSISGVFEATPVTPVCHHFPSLTTPFPYTQQDLYSARQPALFLLDAGNTLWLWQGWWEEERGDEENEMVNGGGVGEVRWQAERRAAMHTTLEYSCLRTPDTTLPSHLVWAGLEPLDFTNLFPTWTDRDDIAEINIRDGHKPGEVLPVQAELERLTVSVYPPAQLLQRPLPEGVDPTRLEEYLAPNHFKEVLGLSQEEFSELPSWKQNKLKQEKGLF